MLSINISELILTILNFFLLFFVLDRLLFKPLISFMDARQSRIDAGLEKERSAQEAIEADKQQNEQREAECRRKAEQILVQTREENQRHHAQLLAQLHHAEEEKRKALIEDVERMENEERSELAHVDGELASLLAQRILKDRI